MPALCTHSGCNVPAPPHAQIVVGMLLKYVNLGSGWRHRLFVLRDGVLRYYKVPPAARSPVVPLLCCRRCCCHSCAASLASRRWHPQKLLARAAAHSCSA